MYKTYTTLSIDRATAERLRVICFKRNKSRAELIRDWITGEEDAQRKRENYRERVEQTKQVKRFNKMGYDLKSKRVNGGYKIDITKNEQNKENYEAEK